MNFSRQGLAISFGLILACLQGSLVRAAEVEDRLYFDKSGQLELTAPTGWELVSQTQKDGKRVLEYRFDIAAAPGAKAVGRVTVWQLARSVKLADLTPKEVQAVERGRDAAFEAREHEVDALPGVRFGSGGTQFIYTALEGGRRFSYVHYVGVTGVADARTDLSPAVAVDLRCRNAVDEDAPQHAAAAEALEASCYELMRSF